MGSSKRTHKVSLSLRPLEGCTKQGWPHYQRHSYVTKMLTKKQHVRPHIEYIQKNLSPLIYTEYTLRCGNEEPIWPVIKLWNWSDAHLKSSKTTTWIHDTLTRHLTKAHRFDEIWPRAAPCRRCSHTWTTWPLRCLPKCLGQSSHNFYRDTSCSWFGRGVSFQLWGFFGGVHVSLWECSCNWTWQWPEDFWSHRDYHWKGSLPNAPS